MGPALQGCDEQGTQAVAWGALEEEEISMEWASQPEVSKERRPELGLQYQAELGQLSRMLCVNTDSSTNEAMPRFHFQGK